MGRTESISTEVGLGRAGAKGAKSVGGRRLCCEQKMLKYFGPLAVHAGDLDAVPGSTLGPGWLLHAFEK